MLVIVMAAQPARAWWEFVLLVMGAILTTTALFGVIARVARPHIDRYLRGLMGPIQDQLHDVHTEVSPDVGNSLRDQVAINTGQLVTLGRQVGRVNRQLANVDKRQREAEEVMHDHLAESTVLAATLHNLADLADKMEGND